MGKVLVLFDSLTDCTAQLAALVAEGASGVDGTKVRLMSAEDPAAVEAVLWADGLAVGSPTNLGGISWRMKKFWDDFSATYWNKVDGKLACAFSSQGGHGGGAEAVCLALGVVLQNFGFLTFGVTDYVDKLHTLHYGAVVAKKPRNDFDKACCRTLGMRLAEWVAVFVDGRKDMHPLKTSKLTTGFDIERGVFRAAENGAAVKTMRQQLPEDMSSAPPAGGPRVHLIVSMTLTASENADRFTALAAELTSHTHREAGCINYQFTRDCAQSDRFIVVEEYASERDLWIHSNAPYFLRIVPELGKLSKTNLVTKLHPTQ